MRGLVIPGEHLGLLGSVVPTPRLEQQALGARLGEDIGCHSSPGSGTHNDDVVDFRTGDGLWHFRRNLGVDSPK